MVVESGHEHLPFDHVLALLEGLNRRIGRDFERLMADGPEGMRGSYGRLLQLIGDDGIRPTLLADGAAISKQAVGVRLRELIDRGWVRRESDPDDGRAIIVRLTDEGREVCDLLNRVVHALEAEWSEAVGAHRFATFKAVLTELAEPHLSAAVVDHRSRRTPPRSAR